MCASVSCSSSSVLWKHRSSRGQYLNAWVELCLQNLQRTWGSQLGCPCSISPVEQVGIFLFPTPVCVYISVCYFRSYCKCHFSPWLFLTKMIYCHIEITDFFYVYVFYSATLFLVLTESVCFLVEILGSFKNRNILSPNRD